VYISVCTLHFINVVHLPILKNYFIIVEKRFVCPSDPESYAGSSISIGLPKPDRSEGMGQTKCSLWTSRFEIRYGAINPISEKITVMKPPEPMEEAKTHTGL
jgi:hypothetical protein